MKLAVVGFDVNTFKAHSYLGKHFSEIEYFLVDQNRKTLDVHFSALAILVDQFCIPAEEDLRTPAHLATFNKIKTQYFEFRNKLAIQATPDLKLETPISSAKQVVTDISEIQDIFFDSKKDKFFIEKTNSGVFEYDFIMIEDHELIADQMNRLRTPLFSRKTKNSHIWFSTQYGYEVKKPRDGRLADKSFFIVKDSANEALIDNWYFCHFQQASVLVSQWVPFHQYQNLDYKKFIVERTRQALNQYISYIHLNELFEQFVDTTAGFYAQKGSLKNGRRTMLAPSFSLWSPMQIQDYLGRNLDLKIKKITKIDSARGLT